MAGRMRRLGVALGMGAALLAGGGGTAAAGERVVFSTLDKVTARIGRLEMAVDEAALFGTLEIVTRYCHKNPPEERAEVVAFVEVREDQGKGAKIFSGWMFASSPGLHALEHPIYDLWVIDCHGIGG